MQAAGTVPIAPASGLFSGGSLRFLHNGAMNRRNILLASAAAAAVFSSSLAMAQDTGAPIRLIVPYAPGGPLDITARALAERVRDSLGTVIVDNKGGAGGNIGADAIAKAAPDGLTIGIAATATHAVNPWLYARMPYDAAKDFAGITQMVRVPNVLVMNAEKAAQLKISVADLIAYAKANPGKLNYGSGGNGSAGHLAGEMFKQRAGIFALHIPYRGGNPAQLALLSGEVDFNIDNLATAAPNIRAGKLKALALTSLQASPSLADIDGLSTYPAMDVMGMGEGGCTVLENALGIRPTWINGGMDTFGPGGSVIAAMMAVATGMARHVLCFRTLWEATFQQLMKEGKVSPPGGTRANSWQASFGATSAAHTLALNAQRHFRRYGTTRETLGWIALNQRANAALNPTAIYRDPMTMEDYLSARMITTPFGLYDCDVPCDGAIAVIVSAKDAAKDLAKKPVYIEAVGTQIIERTDWDQTTMTHEPQVLGQSAHLWTRTSLRPSDVDVAQLYDGFSFNCLSWLEALGFCGIGEAKDFLDGGAAIARDGVIPLNTHGGQLSHGRTHGMGLIHEAITQLRGEAGERQVADAKVAVASSGGLTPSGVLLFRTDE